MGIFYDTIKKKDSTLFQFTKFFTVFNYLIYAFVLAFIIIYFSNNSLGLIFGYVALGLMVIRTGTLMSLRYINKTYLKEGSMFSISKPLSIKILHNK